MEFRSFPFEIRQLDEDEGVFKGYANVFDVVDNHDSSFTRTAFDKTLQERGPEFSTLWFHDPRQPVALSTMQADDVGLWTEGQMNLEKQLARDVLSDMKAGIVDRFSIGFSAVRDRMNMETGVREITEAKLFENSLLTKHFASNELAMISEVRSMPGLINHIVGLSERSDVDAAELRSEIEKLHAVLNRYMTPTQMPTEQRAVPEFQDWPLTSREREWDGDAAVQRLQVWASEDDSGDPDTIDFAEYRKGFLMYDPDNAEQIGGYKMPIADIVNGEPRAVPRGVFAAARVLEGAMGGVDPFEEGDMDAARNHLEQYYAKMRDEFDDDEIVAPWNEENSVTLDDIQRALDEDESFRADVAKLLEETAPPDPGTRSASTPISDDHLDELMPQLEQLSKQLEGSVN